MSSSSSFRKTTNQFYEKQKFKSILLFAFLILLEFLFIYASLEQVVANKPWGLKPTNSFLFIFLTLLIPTPLLIGFYVARLETIINEDGIFYRWAPFKKKYRMIDWKSITEINIIDVGSAGFTWRFSSKYGEVQYTGGGYGIQIKMKSGRRRLLGTHKPEELNRILIRMAGTKYQPAVTKKSLEYD